MDSTQLNKLLDDNPELERAYNAKNLAHKEWIEQTQEFRYTDANNAQALIDSVKNFDTQRKNYRAILATIKPQTNR